MCTSRLARSRCISSCRSLDYTQQSRWRMFLEQRLCVAFLLITCGIQIPERRSYQYGERMLSAEGSGTTVCSDTLSTNREALCGGFSATQGFLDVAKLVASSSSSKGAFDDFAYEIGRNVYADLNGWHLYLKDMSTVPGGPKMSAFIAEQVGQKILTDGFDERSVEDFLKTVPVKLGAGKLQVSLDKVVPGMCVKDLMDACQEFSRNA